MTDDEDVSSENSRRRAFQRDGSKKCCEPPWADAEGLKSGANQLKAGLEPNTDEQIRGVRGRREIRSFEELCERSDELFDDIEESFEKLDKAISDMDACVKRMKRSDV